MARVCEGVTLGRASERGCEGPWCIWVCCLPVRCQVGADALTNLKAILVGLNPKAQLLTTDWSRVCPTDVLCTDLFSMDDAEELEAWDAIQQGQFVPKVSTLSFQHGEHAHPAAAASVPQTSRAAASASLHMRLARVRACVRPSVLFRVAAVLYSRTTPFHPGRLSALLAERGHALRQLGLVRSKGVFWLATRSVHTVCVHVYLWVCGC